MYLLVGSYIFLLCKIHFLLFHYGFSYLLLLVLFYCFVLFFYFIIYSTKELLSYLDQTTSQYDIIMYLLVGSYIPNI